MKTQALLIGITILLIIGISKGMIVNITDYYENATSLVYDYDNKSSYASWSYKDASLRNPNVFLRICNVSQDFYNVFIDLRYATESGNLSESVLSLLPLVNLTNLSSNCSLIDIDISSFKALYPAYPFFFLLNSSGNKSVIAKYKLSESFNGSYKIGIDVDNVDKITYITITEIYDDEGKLINTSYPKLYVTIMKNATPVAEGKTQPRVPIAFNYTFVDEEEIYVNGILSLKVKTFEPCGVINESGYYILNASAWNVNDTCIVIENVSNIFLNFANLTIDGDYNVNGSLREDVCGILIENSENISLYDTRVENFRRGVCIKNSRRIKIYGTHVSENLKGIYVENASAEIINIILDAKEEEVLGVKNSYLKLKEVKLPQDTKISFEASDIALRDVPDPPPDREGYKNINQFANISKSESDAWVYKITFHYTYPLPNNVTHVVYISKIDGIYLNGTWVNLTYEDFQANKQDFSDKTGKLTHGYAWIEKNFTDFSIFVPYGLNITAPQPVPQPQPTPTPTPSRIIGKAEEAIPPKLNLTLHTYEITIQQGETKEIGFNLTNEGKVDVFNALVLALVRKGWVTAGVHFDAIRVGETKISKFYLKVYENEIPGIYYIPVKAMLKENNVTVDVEILKVKVIPRQRVAKIDILEILPYLSLAEYSKIPISILVENTGDYDLHDLRLTIEGAEKCIEKVEGEYDLKKGEKKSLTFIIYTKGAGEKCTGVYVFKSKEGTVGMYPVIIKIRPKTLVEIIKIFPIIYIIWTLFTIFTIYKRLKKRG